MSAKLLNSIADENPDLHKQIGCMTGIFQMFDRHHLLTGRRHHRKKLPSGDDALSDSHLRAETSTSATSKIVLEKKLSKSLNENQRVSVESSRTSFSSSSCSSSFSSLECSKSTQQEPSDRTTVPERPLKNTTAERSDVNPRLPSSTLHLYPLNLSSSGRQPVDFRDIVKESIHRDNHSLSIKTSNKGEGKRHVLKPKDSPRPLPLPETTRRSYPSKKNEKTKMTEDLSKSIGVLAKLKEAPRYFQENGAVKVSDEAKDGTSFPVAREKHRFSYDGREISRSSVDSREQSKCSPRLRELPRLSLDSRKSSMSDSKSHSLMRELGSNEAEQKGYRTLSLEQDLETPRQTTSVVARLMGLEALPLSSGMQGDLDVSKRSVSDSNTSHNLEVATPPSSKLLKMTGENKEEMRSCSPKSSIKDLTVSQSRSVELETKPVPNSRIPIETAPWKQVKSQGKAQQMAFRMGESRARQQRESVYSEIARKLKDLEFQQSNKDLRALKQILDAIQAKGQQESNINDDPSSEVSYKSNSITAVTGIHQKMKISGRQVPHIGRHDTNLMKRSYSSRPSEAPIVIMKPAKSINKSNSLIPYSGVSILPKVRTGDDGDDDDVKKVPDIHSLDKEETLRIDLKESAIQILLSPKRNSGRHREESCSQRAFVQMGQLSPRLQPPSRESSESIKKASGSMSPRRQQKRNDLEKKARPTVPSPDSAKSKKQISTRQISEAVSPRSRLRARSEQSQLKNDKLGENHSDPRNLRNHSDEVSLRTESTVSLTSQIDTEVTSVFQPVDLISESGSPTNSAVSNVSSSAKEKKSLKDLSEEASAEHTVVSLDQPSPVSVLDASFYRDDLMPHSPINRLSSPLRRDGEQNSDTPTGIVWKTAGPDSHLPNNPNCDFNSTVYHRKLESIENLLQKLRKLSLSGDGESIGSATSLPQFQNPDNQYAYQMLFASGLLSSSPANFATPIRLHKSGYAIDPNMFFVLEQTKPQASHDEAAQRKGHPANIRRRLLFDTVNEISTQKLEAADAGLRYRRSSVEHADNTPTGEVLLRQVWAEIERLQALAQTCNKLKEEEEDSLKPLTCEDVAREAERWKGSGTGVAEVVLDVERCIFRDLINEVVNGEAAAFVLAFNPIRRRKPLL